VLLFWSVHAFMLEYDLTYLSINLQSNLTACLVWIPIPNHLWVSEAWTHLTFFEECVSSLGIAKGSLYVEQLLKGQMIPHHKANNSTYIWAWNGLVCKPNKL